MENSKPFNGHEIQSGDETEPVAILLLGLDLIGFTGIRRKFKSKIANF